MTSLARLFPLAAVASLASLAAGACSSSSPSPPAPAGPTGTADGACVGDTANCISGTVITRGFNVPFSSARVELYPVFPYGSAKATATAPVTADGNYALSGLDAGGRYYLQGIAKFSNATGTFGIASVVGPVTLPAKEPVQIKLRPVFLEALQQRPTGGGMSLAWASAHVFDPNSGKELSDAKVKLHAGATAADMPFVTNLSGQQSYFAAFDRGAPAAAELTIDVGHASFGNGATFTLAADTPDFDARVTAPKDASTISAGQPLQVAWSAEPRAAYAIVQLFGAAGGGAYARKYTSDAPRGPTVTSEDIPASALAAPGSYLLNVQMARPSCPPSADGCVYNASTAAISLTVK